MLVAKGQRVWLFEIKNPESESGKPSMLKANQKAWHAAWRGPPVHVVWTREEALRITSVEI